LAGVAAVCYLWGFLVVPFFMVHLSIVQALLIMLVFVFIIKKHVKERELCPFLFCLNAFLSKNYQENEEVKQKPSAVCRNFKII
jgi:hypothetical protein